MVVVNPNAGNRKGEKDWPKISSHLDLYGFDFTPVFTKNRSHAISLTMSMIEKGYRRIIVVGGDGTLNEVINGIFLQKACNPGELIVGMIPVGTGNDWGRTYQYPKKYKKAIRVIQRHRTFKQDIGYVTYHDEHGNHDRYFANMSGMGYDALVAQKTNRMKESGRGGSLAYLINIFAGLFQYRYSSFRVDVDGKEVFRGRVLSMNIGICKYNGGGLMQLPEAIPDDGLLDVTIIKATARINIFKHINKLYDGSFVRLKFVNTYRGEKCSVISSPPGSVFLEADGESLGHSPLEFSVLPKALNFIIPGKQ